MNEQLEEQASLYALDLLEPAECASFEAQLATNPELREQVDVLRETAAKFAHGAPLREPPPHLHGQILNAIRTGNRGAETRIVSMNWLPWALAAGLAICCALLAVDRAKTQKHLAALEKRNAISQMQIATLASQLDTNPNANAVVVWDEAKQQGVLKVSNVSPNEANHDYQLWIVDPEYKQPVDAGVFHVAEKGTTRIEFKPKEPIKTANAFAVSLERKGGVAKAEGPMVLLGK